MKKQSKVFGFTELIKHLYVYIVLIITLVISIFGGINLFNAVADYAIPTPYNDNYFDYISYGKGETLLNNGISEEVIKQNFEEMQENRLVEEKARGLKSIIRNIGALVIALPIFFVFQKKVNFRREKDLAVVDEDENEEENKN